MSRPKKANRGLIVIESKVLEWLGDYATTLEQLAHFQSEKGAASLYERATVVKQYLAAQKPAADQASEADLIFGALNGVLPAQQAGPGTASPDRSHFDIFLGVNQLAREILRLTDTVPVQCSSAEDFVRKATRGG